MWIVIAFIAFITITAAAGTIHGTIRMKYKLDLIRFAIEKGQPIDPALIDTLMRQGQEEEDPPATTKQTVMGLRIGAIMGAAAGAGLPLLGYFLTSALPQAFMLGLGIGAFLLCCAIGLLVASMYVARAGTDQTA